MLTSRAARRRRGRYHGRSASRSSASPPKTHGAQPVQRAASAWARISWRNALGVWFEHRDAFAGQQRVERLRRAADRVRHARTRRRRGPARPTVPTPRSRTRTSGTASRRRLVEARTMIGRAEQARQCAVLDHHALGLPGRAGGVDHVGQVSARAGRQRAGSDRRRGASAHGQVVEQHAPAPHRRQRGGQAATGSAPPTGAQSREHVGQPLGRVARVERHVAATGLEDGEQRRPACRRRARRTGRPADPGPRPARAGAARAGWRAG